MGYFPELVGGQLPWCEGGGGVGGGGYLFALVD